MEERRYANQREKEEEEKSICVRENWNEYVKHTHAQIEIEIQQKCQTKTFFVSFTFVSSLSQIKPFCFYLLRTEYAW